jgi:signal transduction histidine kinase
MKRLGIKTKLALHSAVILTALGAAVTLYSLSQLRAVIYQEMFQRIEAQALNWIEANTSQIILNGDPRTLNRIVNELKQRDSVSYVILADDQHREDSSASPPPDLVTVARSGQGSGCPPLCWKQTQDATGVRYFELTASISAAGTGMSPDLGTLFGAAAGNAEWGELRIGVNRYAFDQQLNGLIAKNVLLATTLIAAAIVVSFALAKPVVTPIVLIARTANQIAAGNLSQRVQRGANLRDEVGDLVRNFNHMALRLEENRAEMSSLQNQLENKVRQRTQALEEANRQLKEIDQLKSNFISTVSHELRTPLTSIKAYAEILLDATNLDSATVGHFLDIINQEAERMSRLIANLLSLEKIESGTTVWSMGPCDLERIIRTAVVVLAPALAEKDISVKLHLEDRPTLWADSDRIQEVLTNLVSNGIRFCNRGGHITIGTNRTHLSGPSGTPGNFVQIGICDDGPGIAPSERERIFDRFYQGSRSSSGGSGLGLAISREIVLHHGGEIWLVSVDNGGASFFFTLPLGAESSESSAEGLSLQGKGKNG